MSKTTGEIAQLIQGKLIGDDKISISGITNIEAPGPGLITFVENPKYLKKLEATEIACLIVPPTIEQSSKPIIQFPLPKLAWAKLLDQFHPSETFETGISDKASISDSAKIGNNVTVEPFAVVGDQVEVGDNTIIRSHVVIGKKVKIGSNSLLHPSVTVYSGCEIGNSVIIHSGTVIGTDGFGYVHTPEAQEKVPQVGNVVIEDDVEIGANATIDCATIGSTIIGKGCKIDNLVQIAHNVVLGPHTVISSQTGISGSCKIGSHVTMGGKAGLGDHVEIGDWTMVGAGAGFPSGKKVPGKQIVFGQPARPYQEARKQIGAQLRSAETLEEVRRLKKKVQALEEQIEKSETPKS